MRLSIFTSLVVVAALAACSANSDGGGSDSASGSGASPATGSGATSSTGATGANGSGASVGTGGTAVLGAGAGPSGTGGTEDVENGQCAQQNFVLSSKPADVLLVLDRSASMEEHDVKPGVTRWKAVVPALKAVINETNATVSWGLKVFPVGTAKSCSEATLVDKVEAEIMPANAAKVTAIIEATAAEGNGTPTGNAITQATAYLKARGASNQYILLATDGQPSCPDGDDGRDAAYTAISAALTAGYKTFVVGVLDPVADKGAYTVLNRMAELGGTSRSDNPVGEKFYFAGTEADLSASLKAVTGQVVSCVFDFTKAPPDPTNIAVKINGVKIGEDPSKANGWAYLSDAHLGVELFGAACAEVKDATENKVDIIFGCKGMPIP